MTGSLHFRVLSIIPTPRGFGFALLDGDALTDWGMKTMTGDKKAQCLAKVEPFITHYRPDVLTLEDFARSKRGPRIRQLIRQIIDLAPKHQVGVKLFSREQVYQTLLADVLGTKEILAATLAKRFPEELGARLPAKRKPWMSEDHRMAIFEAVAFGLAALL